MGNEQMEKLLESIRNTFKANNDHVFAGHLDHFRAKLRETKEYVGGKSEEEIQDELRAEASYLVTESVERVFATAIKPLFVDLVQVGMNGPPDPIQWAYELTEQMVSTLLPPDGNDAGELSFTTLFRRKYKEKLDALAHVERVELAKRVARLSIAQIGFAGAARPRGESGSAEPRRFVTRAPLQRAIELLVRHSPKLRAKAVAEALDQLENKDLVKKFTDQKDFPSFSWIYNGHHPELLEEFEKVVSRVKKRIQKDENDSSTYPRFFL